MFLPDNIFQIHENNKIKKYIYFVRTNMVIAHFLQNMQFMRVHESLMTLSIQSSLLEVLCKKYFLDALILLVQFTLKNKIIICRKAIYSNSIMDFF